MIYTTRVDPSANTPLVAPPSIDVNGVLHFNGKFYVERLDFDWPRIYMIGNTVTLDARTAIEQTGHTFGCSKWVSLDSNIERFEDERKCNLCESHPRY